MRDTELGDLLRVKEDGGGVIATLKAETIVRLIQVANGHYYIEARDGSPIETGWSPNHFKRPDQVVTWDGRRFISGDRVTVEPYGCGTIAGFVDGAPVVAVAFDSDGGGMRNISVDELVIIKPKAPTHGFNVGDRLLVEIMVVENTSDDPNDIQFTMPGLFGKRDRPMRCYPNAIVGRCVGNGDEPGAGITLFPFPRKA